MSAVTQLLANNGLMLLGGTTAILLCGALTTAIFRSPLHRQRVCELSVLATLVWLVFACIPMPRAAWGKNDMSHAAPIPAGPVIAPVTIAIPPGLIAKSNPATIETPLAPIVTTPSSSRQPIEYRAITARLYIAGAAVCMAWLALGHALLWRLIRRSTHAPLHVIQRIESHLPRNGQFAPRILIAPTLARPVTSGVFRPTILLPQSLLRDDRTAQLRQTLLHELGHVQQRDGLGSLLFNLSLPLLYFHPLYWYLRRTSTLARELVVDDWAARADGKETYITQLIELARASASAMMSPIGAIGILQPRSHFYRRMHMLLDRHQPLATRCSNFSRLAMGLIAIALVAALTSTLGIKPASAQPASDSAANKPPIEQPDPKATSDELMRREDALWKSLEKEIILVNGKPTNLQEISARFEVERAKLREQLKREPVQHRPENPTSARSPNDPNLSLDDRLRAHKALDDLNEQQISMLDMNMKRLVDARDELQQTIATSKKEFGQDHPKVQESQAKLEALDIRIRTYAAEWHDMQKKTGALFIRDSAGAQPRLPAAPAESRVTGVQLDLVNLANTMVDAWGAMRLAEVKYAVLAKAGEQVHPSELENAKVNLETANKRLEMLRAITAISLQSAEAELAAAKKLQERGFVSDREVNDAIAKLKMLKMIMNGAQ